MTVIKIKWIVYERETILILLRAELKILEGLTKMMRVLKSNINAFKLNDKRQEIFISVISELGGMLAQINVKGKEILYLNSDLLGKKDIMAGGFPYLFPICGSITDGKYLIKDEEFHMPQHGFTRNMPWKVVSNVTNEKSITMIITHNEQSLDFYPFKSSENEDYFY